jgi:hypothetical protein
VIAANGHTYDPEDIRDLLDEYGDRVLFTKKEKPKTNGHDAGNGEWTGPIDVDALLAAMRLHGKDGAPAINQTLLRCSASLLSSGLAVELVIEQLLDAVRRILTEDEARAWNQGEDRFRIEGMCFRFVEKNPHLAFTLPDALRSRFEEFHNAGKAPRITRNRYGWYVKASNGNGNGEHYHQEHAETNGGRREGTNSGGGARPRFTLEPLAAFDLASLPPRQWLYGKHYQRRTVSATIAPGGAGKTSLNMVEAVAMVTGRNLLGEQPKECCRVWLHNGEDPIDELRRRLGAICKYYDIPHSEWQGKLYMTSGTELPLKVAHGYNDLKIDGELIDIITKEILEKEIDVAMFDPLVTLHSVAENDNTKMDAVIRIFTRIADVCDCAIDVSHHTRKLPPGANQDHVVDDLRGAVAVRDAVRMLRVLNVMSVSEGSKLGLDEFERLSYFRVDRGKANMLAPARAAIWRKFENVPLPSGDHIGVVTAWAQPEAGSPEARAAELKAEALFLKLLDRFTAAKINVNNNASGPGMAPTAFAGELEAKEARIGKEALAEAMHRLLRSGMVRREQYGPPSRALYRLIRSDRKSYPDDDGD